MCVETLPTKCRSRQLFDAAETVIDKSRELAAANSFQAVNELLVEVRRAVEIFDRLNRGL